MPVKVPASLDTTTDHRPLPGHMVHSDVKWVGWIPDGSG
ncbi:hypothetical protein SAMN02745831_00948 [Streptomyces sp. PgraA7]|nr:hypothetical protein SAMN02745831_00948 [Streptomyces sp. PgraA7]